MKRQIEIKTKDEQLADWLKSSYSERFDKLMRLRKINKMLNHAQITHPKQ
jgi:hypothetical protein